VTKLTLTLAAALVLLPLAADARTAKPRAPRAQADAPQPAGKAAQPGEVDLSTLQTTEFGTGTRRPRWQANPTHTYNARGVDCTLYPARCRH
jgi:hypothetical protein